MPYPSSTRDQLRESLKSDLAREMGCNVADMPTAASLDQAGRFLGVTNNNTFHVWKTNKRYPLVWMKKGRALQIGTASLIELRLAKADIPEGAAA